MMKSAIVLLTVVPLVLALLIFGRVRRDGRNSDCTWPGEAGAAVLPAREVVTARHLSADTEFAEELADRYMQAHFGPRSGYAGPPRAGAARHECMAKLFQEIGQTHGVSTEQVVAAFGRNRIGIDVPEILSFAVLFAYAAILASGWIWARYPAADGWVAGTVMILVGSVGFGVAAVLVGPMWTMVLENLRIGTGHLGARVLRLPMERYPLIVFCASVALFLVTAILCRPKRDFEAERARETAMT